MTWSASNRGAPIIAPAGYGETSVQYFANLDRWMFLGEEMVGGHNQIIARFADLPEGPWGEAIVVHDMGDAGFRSTYCCGQENVCVGATVHELQPHGLLRLVPVAERDDGRRSLHGRVHDVELRSLQRRAVQGDVRSAPVARLRPATTAATCHEHETEHCERGP